MYVTRDIFQTLNGDEEPRYVLITLAGVSINFALIVSLPNSLLAAQRWHPPKAK